MDDDMASVMAGLYGRVKPHYYDEHAPRRFLQSMPLAALYAMGTIDTQTSNETRVAPQINGIYVFFTLLPLAVLLLLLVLGPALRDRDLPIPKSPWELLVMGKENSSSIRARIDPTKAFSEPPKMSARPYRMQNTENCELLGPNNV